MRGGLKLGRAMASRRSLPSPAAREEQRQALRAVGAELRAARLARDDDLEDIAACLRIRSSFLAALETGDVDATPGRPYALGFLRSYAGYLGIEAAGALATVKAMGVPAAPCRRATRPIRSGGMRMPAAALLVASVLLAVVALGYRGYDAAGDERPASVAEGPSIPASIAPAAKDADVTAAVAAETVPPAVLVSSEAETALPPDPAVHDGRLVLVARASRWIRLSGGEQGIVRSGTLAAGDRVVLPDRLDLKLSTDNAADVEVLLDGRSIGPLGAAGELVHDLAMDPDMLARRLAQPR